MQKLIRITVAGDLMCKGREAELLFAKFGEYRFSDYIGELKPVFSSSDYVIGNLETPVCTYEKAADTIVSFNTPVQFLDALKEVGFNFLSLANNHCLDCGIEGLESTIQNVRQRGFDCDGAFLSREESERVCVVNVRGLRIAIVSSTFGTNSDINGVMLPEDEIWRVALTRTQYRYRRISVPKDSINETASRVYVTDCSNPVAIGNPKNEFFLEKILAKITRAKMIADLVIALPHLGGQYNPGPAAYTKYVVKRMKDAGADIVIAGHPHTVHRCESWKRGRPFCAYSLGNTCFTPGIGYFIPNTLAEYGVILHLDIDEQEKRLAGVRFNVVKSVLDDGGCAHTVPVSKLWDEERIVALRDRMEMETEAVVNRFCGTGENIKIEREYQLPEHDGFIVRG